MLTSKTLHNLRVSMIFMVLSPGFVLSVQDSTWALGVRLRVQRLWGSRLAVDQFDKNLQFLRSLNLSRSIDPIDAQEFFLGAAPQGGQRNQCCLIQEHLNLL